MAWKTIEPKLDAIGARRILLTHMAQAMLDRRHEVTDPRAVLAEDGLTVRI
jgi:hypothetical protein